MESRVSLWNLEMSELWQIDLSDWFLAWSFADAWGKRVVGES